MVTHSKSNFIVIQLTQVDNVCVFFGRGDKGGKGDRKYAGRRPLCLTHSPHLQQLKGDNSKNKSTGKEELYPCKHEGREEENHCKRKLLIQ